MKLYCPSCGQGTEYSLTKPKFCAACGKAFDSAFATSNPLPVSRPRVIIETEEDGETLLETPIIDKAAVEILVEKIPAQKWGEVMGTGAIGIKRKYNKISRKKAVKEILNECKSSREKSNEI